MYGRSARQAIPSLHHREHLELYYTCCQNTCADCEKDFMGAEYYNSEKKALPAPSRDSHNGYVEKAMEEHLTLISPAALC